MGNHHEHEHARGLTEHRHGVHGADPLCQEGVGSELGELIRPQVGGDDVLLGHPVGVHLLDGLDSLPALGGLPATDEHSVGLEQVVGRRALGKETLGWSGSGS